MKSDDIDSLPLLIFALDGVCYGVDATRVRGSVWLPELTPVEEAPPWVVGLFDLRGRIVPVVDLHLRFGHATRRYSPGDQVVVVEVDQLAIGLIVSEIREVIELSANTIRPRPRFDAASPGPSSRLVTGEMRVGDDLVALLDVARLTHIPEDSALACATPRPASAGKFCPEATPAERALFRARAMALRQAGDDDAGARLGLAVVRVAGEIFGVELAAVQQFCEVTRLTHIPCCPPHVLGAMSLHGNLLTLIDPRAALNLPPETPCERKAVIGRIGDQAMGVAVDEVHDVVYLRQEELQAPSAALRERYGAGIAGTAPYAEKMMTVLDLPALLARAEWIVDETV